VPPTCVVNGGAADPAGPPWSRSGSLMSEARTVMFAVPLVYAETLTRVCPEPPTPAMLSAVAPFAEAKTMLETMSPVVGFSKNVWFHVVPPSNDASATNVPMRVPAAS
jgi:hypothetical protein